MGVKIHFPKKKSLTPIQNLLCFQRDDDEGKGNVKCNRLYWWTSIRPSPLSRAYKIRIVFQPCHSLEICVLSPPLKSLVNARRIPHLYDQKKEKLCLYLPGTRELDFTLPLSQQLLPWAALWFFYFEEWLESNEWKGGGAHPR
jgi:hypothetical protein